VTDYALMVSGNPGFTTPHLRQLATTHLCDLLAVAVGGTRDAIEVAKHRGLRAARLNAVKADIVANLDRPSLSPGAVAARQGLSPRYLRRLFEHEDTSFSAFVLDQRLARAYRMLTDPRMADRAITVIAFAVGFGDLSYFNRTFRRRFGAPPSDVRERARRDGPPPTVPPAP
jgi:AraC-like DNA-binding protein